MTSSDASVFSVLLSEFPKIPEVFAGVKGSQVSQIANGPAAAHALHRVVITMKFPGRFLISDS